MYDRSKGYSVESTGRTAPAFTLYGKLPVKVRTAPTVTAGFRYSEKTCGVCTRIRERMYV